MSWKASEARDDEGQGPSEVGQGPAGAAIAGQVEVQSRQSLIEEAPPIDDRELTAMTYGDALHWAAGPDGFLVRERLKRIAAAKHYQSPRAWVARCAGRTANSVLRDCEIWQEQLDHDSEGD